MSSLNITRCVLSLLFVVFTTGACSQQLSQGNTREHSRTAIIGEPSTPQTELVFAFVTAIDPHSGVVTLDSEIGRLQTVAAATQLQELRTGDLVLIPVDFAKLQQEFPQEEVCEDMTLI